MSNKLCTCDNGSIYCCPVEGWCKKGAKKPVKEQKESRKDRALRILNHPGMWPYVCSVRPKRREADIWKKLLNLSFTPAAVIYPETEAAGYSYDYKGFPTIEALVDYVLSDKVSQCRCSICSFLIYARKHVDD